MLLLWGLWHKIFNPVEELHSKDPMVPRYWCDPYASTNLLVKTNTKQAKQGHNVEEIKRHKTFYKTIRCGTRDSFSSQIRAFANSLGCDHVQTFMNSSLIECTLLVSSLSQDGHWSKSLRILNFICASYNVNVVLVEVL